MKKIIIMNILALFVASMAFASATGAIAFDSASVGQVLYGSTGTATPGQAGTTVIGRTSNGVGIGWTTADVAYAMITQHQQGNRAYLTTYDSTIIYMQDVTKGTPETGPTKTGSDSFDGWTSM